MRRPKYISPTSLSIFYNDPLFYYLRYMADNKLPRTPQTKAMSVGSSFDAFVKNYLYRNVHGGIPDSTYELEAIFESQVESHVRDWAWAAGKYVFEEYQKSGSLADISKQMLSAKETPRFEFDVLSKENGPLGVPFFGKPDLSFINKEGARIIYDWKVNGYCTKGLTSPKKGYIMLRAGDSWTGRRSSIGKSHKKAEISWDRGTLINTGCPFEEIDKSWASQLSIYSWCLGEKVGSPTIIGIDQIVAKGDACKDWEKGFHFPELRFASHRSIVGKKYQLTLLRKAKSMWKIINSDHIFTALSKKDSQKRCKILDNYALGLNEGETYKQRGYFG